MAEDFGLLEDPAGVYALTDPITDPEQRLVNRFNVLLLSGFKNGRGSLFVNELAAGRVKTNSDVVGLFALSSTEIVSAMRVEAQDIYPLRTQLDSFQFLGNNRIIELTYTVVSTEGSIQETVVVDETDG